MGDATVIALGTAATIGIAIAALGGYFVGYWSAVSAPNRLLRRAGRDSERCLNEAAAAVDLASRFCEAVANASVANERQIDAIADRLNRLLDVIASLRKTHRKPNPAATQTVEWARAPVDIESELPNRSAFEANVATLMKLATEVPLGGILLVSLDDAERLRSRIGDLYFRNVSKTVARVLCRAGSDSDLACRIDTDTFALLMPNVDVDGAVANADAVREAFRKHPFRLAADGPECLVTASFGLTPVLPSDELRLITDRTRAAVSRSRKLGRNRLHLYDPADRSFVLVRHADAASVDQAALAAMSCT
jgi:diguanylate cyclase (GGDEF)-like protein